MNHIDTLKKYIFNIVKSIDPGDSDNYVLAKPFEY